MVITESSEEGAALIRNLESYEALMFISKELTIYFDYSFVILVIYINVLPCH